MVDCCVQHREPYTSDISWRKEDTQRKLLRRKLGEKPPDMKDLDCKKYRREMKSLFMKGGRGGKVNEEKTRQ